MIQHVVKEMGISHREFFNTLPRATGGRRYEIDDRAITIVDGDRRVEIDLAPESRRNIASMSLPVTRVEMRFVGYDAAQADAFVRQFDLHFRRGGG